MENNTSRPTDGSGAEPYVGMPIYLDDSFFDFMNEDVGSKCPMPYDMDDEMNEMMPGTCPTAPGNWPMTPGTCPTAPENNQMAPGNCPMMPGNCPAAPGNCPMTPGPVRQHQGTIR
ncbi:hypothetical protein [Aminipila terrae]|uniref:Uncharacterized protein n=1 Tax=Aminipila terrae TaxID=2697030 RepID=A0A6P1MLB0_9FIRM|nr:hypothetical protein [Aminipila terrae]QHI71765.1 hypothetical protein Ami3637_04620 [Aminipila terrae]